MLSKLSRSHGACPVECHIFIFIFRFSDCNFIVGEEKNCVNSFCGKKLTIVKAQKAYIQKVIAIEESLKQFLVDCGFKI